MRGEGVGAEIMKSPRPPPPPPVLWLNVDVVSLSFKLELIAVFRQRSV